MENNSHPGEKPFIGIVKVRCLFFLKICSFQCFLICNFISLGAKQQENLVEVCWWSCGRGGLDISAMYKRGVLQQKFGSHSISLLLHHFGLNTKTTSLLISPLKIGQDNVFANLHSRQSKSVLQIQNRGLAVGQTWRLVLSVMYCPYP